MAHISRLPRKPKRPVVIPSQEQLQIGVDKDGHPIWVDCKDLILSEGDDEALAHNRISQQHEATLQKMVKVVLENASNFADATFRSIAPRVVIQKADDGDYKEWAEWVNKNGFQVIQDGLTTIIKVADREIRRMHADVDKRFADEVARRVNIFVKLPQGENKQN